MKVSILRQRQVELQTGLQQLPTLKRGLPTQRTGEERARSAIARTRTCIVTLAFLGETPVPIATTITQRPIKRREEAPRSNSLKRDDSISHFGQGKQIKSPRSWATKVVHSVRVHLKFSGPRRRITSLLDFG